MCISLKKRAESPERHACRQAGSRRGMTLIELLISLTIIAMMTGVAIPLFSSYQNRNAITADAQAVAQEFSYARALQNNPDGLSRTDPTSTGISLKISTITAGSNKLRTLTIFSTTTPDNVIDQLILGSNENISVNGRALGDREFTVNLTKKSPSETFDCKIATPPAAATNFGCSPSLTISIISARDATVTKDVLIQNTVISATAAQYFSISVL